MTLLTARGLTKAFGAKTVLDDVELTLSAKDRIGLIGRNGAGKTTLVRILTAIDEQDQGELIRRRGLTIGSVDQNPDLTMFSSVGDALMSGLTRHQEVQAALSTVGAQMESADESALAALIEEQATLTAELERLGGWNLDHLADAMGDALQVPPKDRAPTNLSLGEQRRVALAMVLLSRPDVLILDEPTNHLDVATIQWLQTFLTSYPGALLLVTHDRYFLDDVANRIVELDRGQLSQYVGNYTSYIIERAEREAVAVRNEQRRQSAIRAELKWVRRAAPARTTKQKARLERFDALVADKPMAATGEAVLQLPHPPRIGKTILEVRSLKKAFGDRVLIDKLDLTLKKGDRIGIVGPNGVGKTTFVRMILGQEPVDGGTIKSGLNTRIVYADQARADLDDSKSVREEVAGDSDKVFVGERAIQVQTFLDQLLFDDGAQRTPVGALSGGERSRVALAKSLREPGNLMILDEPTNDLDLNTLRVLEDALVRFP
ncbi:MAG: ATP-binding cassette domain-containing protein, partial [Myxococcota bacterium]